MVTHVVDNASTDGTAEMIRSEFPEVQLQTLPWNAGFCIANNVVLRRATARYVLLLNPDTEVTPGALDWMLRLMDARPGHRDGQLPAGAARRHLRPRRQALVPHPARRPRPLHRPRPARGGRHAPRPVPRARARRARQRRGGRGERRLHARPRHGARAGRAARRGLLALHGRPRLVLPVQAEGLEGLVRRVGHVHPREGRHDRGGPPQRTPPRPQAQPGVPPQHGPLLPQVLRGRSARPWTC